MRADKPHIHFLIDEQHDCYDSICVALDVKYIAIVANVVHCVERLLYVGKGIPICLAGSLIPVTQRHVSVCMFGYEVPYHRE